MKDFFQFWKKWKKVKKRYFGAKNDASGDAKNRAKNESKSTPKTGHFWPLQNGLKTALFEGQKTQKIALHKHRKYLLGQKTFSWSFMIHEIHFNVLKYGPGDAKNHPFQNTKKEAPEEPFFRGSENNTFIPSNRKRST